MGNIRAPKLHLGGTAVRFPAPVPKFFKLRLKEELSCRTGIYLRRWYLETPLFSIRLHHWLSGDDRRNFHDHPWDFIVFVLSGSYIDRSNIENSYMFPGKLSFKRAEHKHSVDTKGCWTLVFTGPKKRFWGFWVKDKFVKANKYFLTLGSHPCN